MNHPIKVSIYKTKDFYFIVPSWYDNGGYLGIHPIKRISVDSTSEELGQNLLNAVSDCKEGDTDYSQNSFKELLKVTKARSEWKLMKTAKFVGVSFSDDNIKFQLNRVDTSLKCWVGSDEDILITNSELTIVELGENLIKTFEEDWSKQNSLNIEKNSENTQEVSSIKINRSILNDPETSTLLEKLSEAGYFDFINNNSAINKTFHNYSTGKRLEFPFEGLNRVISIDAESLFEAGGLLSLIESIKPTLENIGIKSEISDDNEEFEIKNSTYISRWIIISGKKYEMSGISNWENAFKSGCRIINQILLNNKFNGKLYGLVMDESSSLIILNNEQYEIIKEAQIGFDATIPIDLDKLEIS